MEASVGNDYEPRRGKFDFKWLRQFVELARTNGIMLRPYIGYTPKWAARGGADQDVWNDPPKRVEGWRKFTFELASTLRRYPNVLSYEIYNEENVKRWWDGTAADYNEVLSQAATAIRSINPAIQILLGGMVWPDSNWTRHACVTYLNSRDFDVVPFHAYPEMWTEPGVEVENYLQGYGDFLKNVDRDCGPKPVWINEAGFATSPGKSELNQANWWARAIATFAAAPRIEHIGIYEIKDAPSEKAVIGEAANYYPGLLRRDRSKKLAFSTTAALMPLLNEKTLRVADSEVSVEINDGSTGNVHHHVFVRDDAHQVLFVWDKTGDSTVRVNMPGPGSSAIEIRLNGDVEKRSAHARHGACI